MATRVLAYSDSKVFGGAEAVFCDVAAGLRERPSVDLHVAVPASNGELTSRIRSQGGAAPLDVPAQALSLAALDLYNPLRLRAVRRVVESADADVLLVNLPSAEYGGMPLRLDLGGGRRVGVLHVAGSPRDLGFHVGAVRERLARRTLGSLDVACVLSEGAEGAFRRCWDSGGTELRRVPLPRPTVRRIPREDARRQLGLEADRVWIGLAGRISFKQKGQDTFAHAAARLTAGPGRYGFAVAGAGRDRDRLRGLVSDLGIADAFRFVGQIRPIDAFFSAVDAVAIPSRFEGLALIALEAIAAGVPGIAADIDGLREVWPPEWLVPPGDPERLAGALGKLLETGDDARHRTLEAARRRMEAMTTEDPAAVIADIVAH